MRALPLALVLAFALAMPALASDASPPTRIAILDGGIASSHAEFAPGQVVAWRDFIEGRPEPYDDAGHGTAVASLAAGANLGACPGAPKLSFASGQPLVVGKVLTRFGALPSRALLADAIDWALAEGATVVSISIGSSDPEVLEDPTVGAAFERAAEQGALVLVSGGNGAILVRGLPWVAWLRSFGNIDEALVVGGASRWGEPIVGQNWGPDVTSWSLAVCAARHTGGYDVRTGTSFSTPLVAGMAASVRDAALASGAPSDAARVRELLLRSARNAADDPYAREGLGFLLADEWEVALAHARAGTLPDHAAQGPHARADLALHEQARPLSRTLG